MSISVKAKLAAAMLSASALMAMAGGASAATLDFGGNPAGEYTNYTEDGYVFDAIRIVDGNCTSASGQPCGAENKNETSTLTQVGGGAFSVSNLWFTLLGKATGMTFETNKGTKSYAEGVDFPHNNGGNTLNFSSLSMFQDITYLKIINGTKGNIRFDDIVVSDAPAPVPLPAAGLLLLGGLGLLGAVRRNRKA